MGSLLPEQTKSTGLTVTTRLFPLWTRPIPRQLYGDHGHAPSLQSQSALWINEVAAVSSYEITDFSP